MPGTAQSNSEHQKPVLSANPGLPGPPGGTYAQAPLQAGGVRPASGKASWPHLLRKVPSPPHGRLEGFQEINAYEDASPSLPG